MLSRWFGVAAVALGVWPGVVGAADWPQWRGPHRDGVSEETGLLGEWPEEGPKLLWRVADIGAGYSTPAVVGKRLYLLGNEGTDDEFVQALDVSDGRPVWSTRLGKVGPNDQPPYPGARSTPTVDGDLIYALGSNGDLVCLERGGRPRWKKSLRDDFGGRPGHWAYAESPLIDGDLVVCTPGGEEATLVALDKKTGETVWKAAVPGGDPAAYASIIVVEAAGKKQYVQFLQDGLVGVEAETGKFLWRYGRTAKGSPAVIPTPVAHGDYIYSSAARNGGGLVKLTATDDGVEAEQVYFNAKLPSNIGGAVLADGYLYGTGNKALECVEFETGEIKWQNRSIGSGAVCLADGRLYLHSEEGDVALAEATPEGYQERGRFTPPELPERGNSKAWPYPVVANGRLYIHDFGVLWCYDVSDSEANHH
jgi:outer membrane protein assembly factor BamB